MQEMQDNVTEPVLKDAEAEPETIAPEVEPQVKAKPWRKLVIIGGAVLAVLAIGVGLFVSVVNKPAEKVTVVGTSSTPATNSRTVRPREIRAMKTPTKGAQEIHQPQ